MLHNNMPHPHVVASPPDPRESTRGGGFVPSFRVIGQCDPSIPLSRGPCCPWDGWTTGPVHEDVRVNRKKLASLVMRERETNLDKHYMESLVDRSNTSTPVQLQWPSHIKIGTKTKNDDLSVTHELCSMCCKKNGRLCKACGKKAYCSPECQRKDWPNHKEECLPAVTMNEGLALRTIDDDNVNIMRGEVLESSDQWNGKLITRRNVKREENIASFMPVMMSCNDKGMPHPPDSILCLSCCKWYQSSHGYRCSKCRWPVCSIACEEYPLHMKYECQVFSANRVTPPSTLSQRYDDIILVLRCILLKINDPGKFNDLFQWVNVCELKQKTSTWKEYDSHIVTFLMKKCRIEKLLDIDADLLKSYLKVIDSCSLTVADRVVIHGSEYTKSFVCAKYVFPAKMLVNEECSPNIKWSIRHSSNLEECALRLHSAIDLKPWTYLTASFSTVSEYGASFPKRYGSLRFNTVCSCRRCRDPTELGSFFSAMKCQDCEDEASGYAVPLDPTDPSSEWECQNFNCMKRIKGSFVVQDINRIHNEMLSSEDDYWGLVNLIHKYENTRLHQNHFLILKAATTCVQLFWGSVRGLPFYSPRYDFFTSCINLADRAVRILDKISPGSSIERARILFQAQVAHAYKNLRDFRRYLEWGGGNEKRCLPKVFWELQKIQEEAFRILATESYGSLEHEMSIVLKEVIEDQIDLLCHTPPDVHLDYPSIYNLHKIYTRFSNDYYYPAIPIFEDKDIHEFVISTGPCAKHMVEKINHPCL